MGVADLVRGVPKWQVRLFDSLVPDSAPDMFARVLGGVMPSGSRPLPLGTPRALAFAITPVIGDPLAAALTAALGRSVGTEGPALILLIVRQWVSQTEWGGWGSNPGLRTK